MKHYDIVGCGTVVRQSHAPILKSLVRSKRVRIHGCYDLNPTAAREMGSFLGAARTGVPSDIGDLSGVDGVLIATPPESHASLMEPYLTLGKSVLVEKPFVATEAEARTVVDLAQRMDTSVLVAHFRRFYPGLRSAREFLADGGLGRILRAEATEGGRWSWPVASSYVVESPFGGVIHDTGAHLLDMVLYLLGADTGEDASFEILHVAKSPHAEPSHECRAVIGLRKPGGAMEISFGVSRLEPLAGAVKVYGDSGILIVPTTFSEAPLLLRGAKPFTLGRPAEGQAPRDAHGCFILEHQEFLALGRGTRTESTLSAERFVRLTAILEALGRAST